MKKILLSLLLLCASFEASAFNGTPYIGPTLYEQDITTNDANYRGVRASFSLGYMALFDFYYLAAEAFASPFMWTFNSNHPYQQDGLKISRNLGLGILPGIMITEELIGFLRLGVVRSTFQDPNNIVTGWQGGIGLETSLSTACSLRGEYIYTDYGNINGIGVPRSDEIGLGLIYKFDHF